MNITRRLLSINRALVLDITHFARDIPLFPIERSFDLGSLAALRKQAATRLAWPTLFLKAYSRVAAETPALRQAFVGWPWAHMAEFSESVGMLAINRTFQGEDRLCWGRFIAPEKQSLIQLQQALDAYQSEPVDVAFRRQVRTSRLPTWLRRLGLWIGLYLSGGRRAKRIGTFGISSVAGQGAVNRFHPTITTTSLSYGPVDADGRCLVTLVCDHRVLDGALAARALVDLERVMQHEIADELRSLAAMQRAA